MDEQYDGRGGRVLFPTNRHLELSVEDRFFHRSARVSSRHALVPGQERPNEEAGGRSVRHAGRCFRSNPVSITVKLDRLL